MTVDDLVKIYNEAFWHGEKRPQDTADHAGIRAVVRALRDEFVMMGMRDFSSDFDIKKSRAWFTQILGDAGAEKVTEMPDLPTRTVQLTGITKSQRADIQFEPATDAAPDVCTSCYGTGEDTVMERRCQCQPPDTTSTRCPDCNGEGWDRFGAPCPPCEATGRIPITDAAPAVCVWTQEGWEYRTAGCNGWSAHVYSPKYSPPGNKCPHCKAPIKFTEAK